MNIVAQVAEIRRRGNMISVMSVGFLARPKPHVRIPNANRPFAGFSFPRTMSPEPRLASTAFRGLPKRRVASTERFQILGDTCSSPCIPMARKRVRWNKSKMGLQATTIVMTNKTTHTTIDTHTFLRDHTSGENTVALLSRPPALRSLAESPPDRYDRNDHPTSLPMTMRHWGCLPHTASTSSSLTGPPSHPLVMIDGVVVHPFEGMRSKITYLGQARASAVP
jgi:hypothetical protein